MKTLIAAAVFLVSVNSMASEIILQPGSNIQIQANETTNIACVGPSVNSQCIIGRNSNGYYTISINNQHYSSYSHESSMFEALKLLRENSVCK